MGLRCKHPSPTIGVMDSFFGLMVIWKDEGLLFLVVCFLLAMVGMNRPTAVARVKKSSNMMKESV